VVFEADYDEIEFQNIIMTSSPLRHHNNVTKIFPIWAPHNQNFWLCQCFWVNNLMVFKKSVLGLEKVVLVLKK